MCVRVCECVCVCVCVCCTERCERIKCYIFLHTNSVYQHAENCLSLQNNQKIKRLLKCNERGHVNADNEHFLFVLVEREPVSLTTADLEK